MAVIVSKGIVVPKRETGVAYIQSSETQWINTGVIPHAKTRVVCDFQYLSNKVYQFAFGSRTNSGTQDRFGLMLYGTDMTLRSDYGGDVKYFPSSVEALKRHTVDKNANVCTVDGTTVTNTVMTIMNCTYPLFIFALNNGGTAADHSSVRIYSMQIYDGNNLIRDYWPCYDPDGVACLYDRVNEEYAYNAGTGEFIAGEAA